VCKEGLLVDQEKIATIVDMLAPHPVRELCNLGTHRDIIDDSYRVYAKVVAPLEKLLHKDTKYVWTHECQEALDTLKERLVTASILIFPDWTKIFHVHVDASSIALGAVLVQPEEDNIDHPVYFSSRKLSDSEKNYTTMEHEGLVMVYALQNFDITYSTLPSSFSLTIQCSSTWSISQCWGGGYVDGYCSSKNLSLKW
jgi:hypothetical protein